MNIAIDLGNSFAKLGIFINNHMKQSFDKLDDAEVIEIIEKQQPGNIIVGSVGKAPAFIKKRSQDKNINCMVLDHNTRLPIINTYRTPETLGVDRIAAVVGAVNKFPESNCLVIDAGTCITYDLIDGKGQYWGGSISPGIQMKAKALNTFTARLPLINLEKVASCSNYDDDHELAGKTTEQALVSGIIYGTVSEIEEMIRKYANKLPNLKVIMCGGDSRFFETKIKAHIFVIPELVLTGLNRILQYNVEDR